MFTRIKKKPLPNFSENQEAILKVTIKIMAHNYISLRGKTIAQKCLTVQIYYKKLHLLFFCRSSSISSEKEELPKVPIKQELNITSQRAWEVK